MNNEGNHILDYTSIGRKMNLGEIKHMFDDDLSHLNDDEPCYLTVAFLYTVLKNNPIDLQDLSKEDTARLEQIPKMPYWNKYNIIAYPIIADKNFTIIHGIEYLYKLVYDNIEEQINIITLENVDITTTEYNLRGATYEELINNPEIVYRIVGIDEEMLDISYTLCSMGLPTKFTCIGHSTSSSPKVQIILDNTIGAELLVELHNYLKLSDSYNLLDIGFINLIHDSTYVKHLYIEYRDHAYYNRVGVLNYIKQLLESFQPNRNHNEYYRALNYNIHNLLIDFYLGELDIEGNYIKLDIGMLGNLFRDTAGALQILNILNKDGFMSFKQEYSDIITGICSNTLYPDGYHIIGIIH